MARCVQWGSRGLEVTHLARDHEALTPGAVPQDWEGRYAQFRVAVQTALDRGQTLSSYADIAAQLASKERSVTSAKFAGKSKLAPKAAPAGVSPSACMVA